MFLIFLVYQLVYVWQNINQREREKLNAGTVFGSIF